MNILRTCREGNQCTCLIGQFDKLGVTNLLKKLDSFGVTDLRMQCGDYQERIGFLLNGQDEKQRDVCLMARKIEQNPSIFPEALIFPEMYPSIVDANFTMRNK